MYLRRPSAAMTCSFGFGTGCIRTKRDNSCAILSHSPTEAVVYYTPEVLKAAGLVSRNQRLLATVLVGLAKTFFIGVGAWLIDRCVHDVFTQALGWSALCLLLQGLVHSLVMLRALRHSHVCYYGQLFT